MHGRTGPGARLLPPGMRCTAYFFAQHRGLPVAMYYLTELGVRAARAARWYGLVPVRVPEGIFPAVNTWEPWLWEQAAASMQARWSAAQYMAKARLVTGDGDAEFAAALDRYAWWAGRRRGLPAPPDGLWPDWIWSAVADAMAHSAAVRGDWHLDEMELDALAAGHYPPRDPPLTRVVHCQRKRYDVLIDRSTPWGNPFVIGRDGSREQVVAKYAAWAARQPGLRYAAERDLRGKVLGCWCKPAPCHGDVLAAMAEGRMPNGRPAPFPDPLAAWAAQPGQRDDFWSYPAPPEDTQAYADWCAMADEHEREVASAKMPDAGWDPGWPPMSSEDM